MTAPDLRGMLLSSTLGLTGPQAGRREETQLSRVLLLKSPEAHWSFKVCRSASSGPSPRTGSKALRTDAERLSGLGHGTVSESGSFVN